jgi:DNA polymerase-3 subunit alpha/error-prone DNA polymerase
VIVLNPDINRSSFNFTTEGMRSVRVGFNFIRDLSITTVKKIIGERSQNGDFKSLDNFSKRVYAGDADLTTLVKAGVFDEISGGLSRSDQLMRLLVNSCKPSTELTIFEEDEPLPVIKRTNRSTEKILRQQFSSLGFLTDRHPLFLYRFELKSVTNRVLAKYLKNHVRKKVTLAGWPVALKFVPTKDRRTMAFYSFDDETALFETVIFPDVFDKSRSMLDMKTPLLISGTVENDHGALQVVVELVRRV